MPVLAYWIGLCVILLQGGFEAVRWLPCCCAVVLRVPSFMWVCLSLLMGAKGLLHLCAGRASQLCQCVAQAGGTCKSSAEADSRPANSPWCYNGAPTSRSILAVLTMW